MARRERSRNESARVAVLALAIGLASPGATLAQSSPATSSPPAFESTADPPPWGPSSVSAADLVRRALASNGELAAARLDVERGRARLRQAGVFANPTLDVERRTGRFTGSRGEDSTSVGIALPLDVTGQRRRRVELAEAEIEAAEAEIADRERTLANAVRSLYAEALAAGREVDAAREFGRIDEETVRFVDVRVSEGESAPLELNLLRAEAERQRSRLALAEGRLESSLMRLRALVGSSPDEEMRLADDLGASTSPQAPQSIDEAIARAIDARPDVRLARIEERVAEAGYRLVRAEAGPQVTVVGRFSVENSVFDETPVGPIRDRDTTLAAGISITLPVFDRRKGASAEAATAVAQARSRRAFVESRVRTEVRAAHVRYRAAEHAVASYETGVLPRAADNVRSIRGAYQVGAFRVTELLAEQRRYAEMRRELVDALAERDRAAADLDAALGITIPAESTPTSPPAFRAESGDDSGLGPIAARPPADELGPRPAALRAPIVAFEAEPESVPSRLERARTPAAQQPSAAGKERLP